MRVVAEPLVGRAPIAAARSEVLELEVALAEGTDNAVFGGGAGINRQRHTGAGGEVVAVAVAVAGVAGIERAP